MFRFSRIDRHFRRFLRTGDPRALGVVFDATASELLKIAAYLARSHQEAEDLVQSTFVVALERRAEFDTERAVMPWLCGILTNLVRAERRRAQRQAGPGAPSAEADPAAVAELEDFRAAVARARDGVAEPYRAVLVLHLEHGLRANEIAGALDRPAGTVRAQITRGLDMLRKRLPRGFVAGAVVVASVSPALRAAVLAHASAPMVRPALARAAATHWTEAVIGGRILNKKLFVAGVIGASLLALGVWFGRGPGDSPLATSPGPGASPVHVSANREGLVVAPAEPPIRQVASDDTSPADTAPRTGSIEVTARWQGDGAPAARQAIEAVCLDVQLAQIRPFRAVTDALGVCVLEGIPAGAVTLFASTGHRQPVKVEVQQKTTVELELESWGTVRGFVVDAHDGPVADADVWVSSKIDYSSPDRRSTAPHGQYGSFTMRTDSRGRFETRLTVRQCLSACKVGYGPSPTIYPCSGNAPSGGIDVTLRLAAEGSALLVEVHDRTGAPVPRALVLAGPEAPTLLDQTMTRATPPARRVNTDHQGRVEMLCMPTGSLPVQVRARGFAPWQGTQELLPSGTSRLLVRLEAAATVRGVVTDSTGAPVAHAIVCHGPGSELRSSSATTDPAGRFELGSLPVGPLELEAWKQDVGSCRTGLVVESGGLYSWRPMLSMRPAITGVVLGIDGKPAVGAYVCCANAAGGRDSVTSHTDAGGRFALGPLQQHGLYSVTAEIVHESQGALRVSRNDVAPETELVLEIAPGVVRTAAVRGRLLEANGTPATQVRVTLTPVDGGYGHSVDVEQTGAFTSGARAPGPVRVAVLRQQLTIACLGEHELHAHETVNLGDICLPTLGGAVLHVSGGDVARGVANLFRDGEYFDSRQIEAQQAKWDALPPGDYRVSVRRGGATPFVGAGMFTVIGGTVVRAELRVQPGQRCELRFSCDAACGPRGTLVVEHDGGREVLRDFVQMPGHDEGLPTILPEGSIRLVFRSEDGWAGETRAKVAAGASIRITLTK
ncbi:MAG: sigma-70 family RNA polymerase sigma factor [Planctomycetota bacterium]